MGAPRPLHRRVAQHGGDGPSTCVPALGAFWGLLVPKKTRRIETGAAGPLVSSHERFREASLVSCGLKARAWMGPQELRLSQLLPHPGQPFPLDSRPGHVPRWTAAGSPQVRQHSTGGPHGRHLTWAAGWPGR